MSYLKEFEKLVNIMTRLRKECPWDRAQTPESLRQYILEEAYETVEAIDRQNWDELRKELGDLLLQIVFQAEIARENQRFELADVIAHINHKMIERHPHVFGDVKVSSAAEVAENWEQIKKSSENRKSILQGVPKELPALLRAQRLQDKASQHGFEFRDAAHTLEKVREELDEVAAAQSPEHIKEEIGDVMFALVNFCRFHNFNAEDALRQATEKFVNRVEFIEKRLAEAGQEPKNVPIEKLDELWDEAKDNNL
jgi:MazG family protein